MNPSRVVRTLLPVLMLAIVAATGAQLACGSHAATVCTVSDKLVNSCRPWIGAWVADYPQASTGVRNQITYHEQRIGRQVDLVKDYKNGGSGLGVDDKYYINRGNTYSVITWKPGSDFGSATGGNATVNASIDKFADSVKSVAPHKIFLSIWHEAESGVSPGTSACSAAKGTAGSPAQFRAMWQNVQNRFAAKGVTNVVWTWIPMGYSGWTCMDKDLYPGNNLVDWIMWDPYVTGDKDNWNKSISSFYDWMSANSDATHDFNSKPWGLAETSSHLNSKANADQVWVDAKASLDANRYPKLKAYIVFDSNAGKQDNRIMYWCDPATAGAVVNNHSTCGNDQIDMNEQNAYKAFADDPRFTDAFYGTTNTPPPTSTSTPPPTSTSTPPPSSTSTPPSVSSGDANGDGHVNLFDLSIVIQHQGENYPTADFDHSGTVGAADLSVVLSKWTGP